MVLVDEEIFWRFGRLPTQKVILFFPSYIKFYNIFLSYYFTASILKVIF